MEGEESAYIRHFLTARRTACHVIGFGVGAGWVLNLEDGVATVKLGKREVDAALAGEKDLFLWDSEVAGFGLKVTPKGSKSFIFAYRMGGRGADKKRYKIGNLGDHTPESARKRAIELRQMVKHGKDPAREEKLRQRDHVELACTRYVERFIADYLDVRWKGGSRVGAGYLRREVVPALGKTPINHITAADIASILKGIASTASRRNTFAVLRRMFRWAIGQGDLLVSPMQHMDVPPAPEAREHTLSDRDLCLVWHAASRTGYPFGPLTQLLMLTGQRQEEVAGLDWRELDRDKQLWTLPGARSKNGETHLVPLSAPVVRVLDQVASSLAGTEGDCCTWPREGWVFSVKNGRSVSGFSNAKLRLERFVMEVLAEWQRAGGEPEGIEAWRFHDLRRTLATGLQSSTRLEVTEAILNHSGKSKWGAAGVYHRHKWFDEKRDALERWAAHIESAVAVHSISAFARSLAG